MEALAVPLAGDLENFFSEHLYPYRWPLAIVFVLSMIALVVVALRLGWHLWAWERRLFTGPALAVFLIVAVPLGYYTISPLVIGGETVCEASPIPGAGSGSDACDDTVLASTNSPTTTPSQTASDATPTAGPTAAPTDAFEAHVVRQGEFEGADDFHFGNGNALLIESEPGEYILRFEEFSVRNGPGLVVYLSPNPSGYDDAALNLGELKGTNGAFNYDIPAGTDISQYQSAIVWCEPFSVLFATATFGPAS